MSLEAREFILQTQKEGIKAAARRADAVGVTIRRENYPKQIYSTNKRISFGGVWRK